MDVNGNVPDFKAGKNNVPERIVVLGIEGSYVTGTFTVNKAWSWTTTPAKASFTIFAPVGMPDVKARRS